MKFDVISQSDGGHGSLQGRRRDDACEGEVIWTGESVPGGMKHFHTCNRCGHTRTILGRRYPRQMTVRPELEEHFLRDHKGKFSGKKK